MLVLSRKTQESVVIVDPYNNDCLVKVTVIEIQGQRVRLGIEAAKEIPIRRSEIWEQVHTGDAQCHEPSDVNCERSEAVDGWTTAPNRMSTDD